MARLVTAGDAISLAFDSGGNVGISVAVGTAIAFATTAPLSKLKRGSKHPARVLLENMVRSNAPHQVNAWIEYPDHNAGIPVKKLIKMASNAGELFGLLEELGYAAQYVTVSESKGSVRKEIANERTIKALTLEERAAIASEQHHCLDAVGLHLFKLGRVMRGGGRWLE
jgi:hypothetical protein